MQTDHPLARTALTIALLPLAAWAAETPVDDAPPAGPELNWTTTVKQSAAFRVKQRDSQLVSGGSSAAQDDGDRNFSKGLVSFRTDVLSELDLKFGDKGGFRFSGAGWVDPVYLRHDDNDSPGTSQGPGRTFPQATAKLHGKHVELLDAFAFTSFDVGGHSATVKLGRHALVYGESLFFGGNGIAYAMVPVDVIKATSVPASQFRELIRPVNQLSGQISLAPDVSLGAYYQLHWERTRLPGAGSYLSTSDMLDAGGSQLQLIPPIPFVTPGFSASRTADAKPGNSGQGGMQLKFSAPDIGTDFGLYAVHYNERLPQVYLTNAAPTGLPEGFPAFLPSEYHLNFGRGVSAYGASFSKGFGASNVAGEMSVRNGAYLASDPVLAYAGHVNARGRTLHLNVSALTSYEPNWLATEATSAAEIACNRRLSVSNGEPVAANADRDACALRVVYEPTYRQVAPGLDLGVPVSASYTHGRSSAVPFFGANNAGDMSVSLNFNYLDRWRLGLGYTHFYGAPGTTLDATGQAYSFRQALADRDFLSMSLATSF